MYALSPAGRNLKNSPGNDKGSLTFPLSGPETTSGLILFIYLFTYLKFTVCFCRGFEAPLWESKALPLGIPSPPNHCLLGIGEQGVRPQGGSCHESVSDEWILPGFGGQGNTAQASQGQRS